MNKYLLYARVGSAEQSKAGISIQTQINKLKELAEERNLEIVEEFTDVGSTKSKRLGFEQMLSKLNTGEFKGIICWDFDRLSRDFSTSFFLINLIERKGIEIVTLGTTYTNKPEDKLVLNMLTGFSQFYKSQISQRIKAGIRKTKLDGKQVFAKRKQV